jgi:hypothetical protein
MRKEMLMCKSIEVAVAYTSTKHHRSRSGMASFVCEYPSKVYCTGSAGILACSSLLALEVTILSLFTETGVRMSFYQCEIVQSRHSNANTPVEDAELGDWQPTQLQRLPAS